MKPESSSKARCPVCGDGLGTDAVEGVCLRCLLDTGAREGARQEAPAIDTIAPFFPELQLKAVLGAGGMGAVYKARQVRLDREIAVKVLLLDHGNEPFASRFLREARALARLNHPNIVTIHDYGEVEDLCYLIMECVDGMDLGAVADMGPLDWNETLRIGRQICDALEFAHAHGVIHRDIKPANVLLREDGFVKLADFGLARLLEDDGCSRLTKTEASMGTLHFTAPEQFKAVAMVDERADVYALGAILYHLLVGAPPIGRFALPSSKAAVSSRVDEVILKALEEDPEARYDSVTALRTALESVEETPSLKRSTRFLWLGLAAAFVVGALVALFLKPASTASRAESKGEGEGMRYTFDRDLGDSNGSQAALTLLGETQLKDSSLVFETASDRAYVVLAAPGLYDSARHRGFEVRLRVRIDGFADGSEEPLPSTVSLLRLGYRWDAFLGIDHSHWLPNVEILIPGPDKTDPNVRLFTAEQAASMLALGSWHTLRLVVDGRGYEFWIDGKQVVQQDDASAISRWTASSNEGPDYAYNDLVTLSVGSFVGAIDDLAVLPLK